MALQALPDPYRGAVSAARPQRHGATPPLAAHRVPTVPPQHALAIYDALLEVA